MAKANYMGIGTEAEINAAKQAINTYIEEVENHLKNLKLPDETYTAFIGKYARNVETYIQEIAKSASAPLAVLKEFELKLQDAQKRYRAKDEEIASSINSGAVGVGGSAGVETGTTESIETPSAEE